MYDIFKELEQEKISLAYFGVFNDKITNLLISLSEDYLQRQDKLKKLSKKTSFLIAESFQNIVRHGVVNKEDILEKNLSKDFFQLSVQGDRISISSANVITNKEAQEFSNYIDNINELDAEGLKNLQLQTLSRANLSEKGGAGLGIIEMVRKSGFPLKKHFIQLSEDFSLVILSMEIANSDKEKQHKISIQNIETIYKRMSEKNIIMFYKGDFSNTSNTNIIEILNNNFMKDGDINPSNLKNIVAIIEVMQNVSKHGKEINGFREGIFALTLEDEELYVECSNFIKQENFEELEKNLIHIKTLNNNQLELFYKDKMANSYLSEDQNGGLGLLEIARFTKNTFNYSFTKTTDDEIFYSIKFKTI